jgi:molecular chaperone GrpE
MEQHEQSESQSTQTPPPAGSSFEPGAGESTLNRGAADLSNDAAQASRDEVLASCEKELVEMKDRYLRTVAEMDNMRKRLEREKQEFLKFSSESILKDMIPVLDSLDKAIPTEAEQTAANVSAYKEGIQMVQKQLLQQLAKHGLEPVLSVEQPFDPNVHQAIQRIESGDVSQETVATEFAKGYILHGRLLRPAMVSVKVPS